MYWIRKKAREEAPGGAKLSALAEVNMIAENYQRQESGNKQDWNLAFEHCYEEGFTKTHADR